MHAARTHVRKLFTTAVAVALAAVLLTPTGASAAGPPDVAPDEGMLFGAFVAKRSEPTVEAAYAGFEQKIDRRLDLQRTYSLWDDTMPPPIVQAGLAEGRTPVLSIEPRLRDGSRLSWASVARGDHDARIRSQAAGIRSLGVPVFLTFHHEPDYAPAHGTGAEFRAAWRHYVETFRAQGVTNVVWTWVVTPTVFIKTTSGPTSAEFYPGDDVVDWLGLDAYNWFGCASHVPAAWRPMAEIAGPFREFGRARGKPLMLAEWGSSEDPANPSRKATWMRESMQTLASWPEIKAVVYFQQHGTCPWWVDSSATSMSGFKDAATMPAAHGAPSAWLQPSTVHGAAPLAVRFDASRSAGSMSPTGTGVASWRFEPGDGSAARTGTGTPPSDLTHTYTTAGTRTARLTVTDAHGLTSVDTVGISAVALPTLSTSAKAITTTSSDLTAWVNPNGLAGSTRFEWGTTTAYGTSTTSSVPAVTWAATVVGRATGLTPSTTYQVRVTATTAAGSTVRTTSFSTAGRPTTAKSWASGTTRTTTTLGANVNTRHAASTVWFEHGTTSALGKRTAAVTMAAVGYDRSTTAAVSSLAPATTHYYRVVAQNAHGTTYGPVQTFRTTS